MGYQIKGKMKILSKEDKRKAEIGARLADVLCMTRDKAFKDPDNERWFTIYGSKSTLGVYNTIQYMLEDMEDE